jgi:hypothetical protein
MITDPYLLFASCFATWLRLKIIMGMLIVLAIILMSLSAWQTVAVGGSFSSKFPGGTYKHWDSICTQYPYNYLSPFTFTYTASNSTMPIGSVATSCPYPAPNSEFRISITVMSMFALAILYVKTPISLIARFILAIFALMFFSAFVIDAAAASVGTYFCQAEFPNTTLNLDLQLYHISTTCTSSVYQLIAAFDFMMSMLFFIVHSAWGMTKDLYVEKGDSDDKKALLGKKDPPKAAAATGKRKSLFGSDDVL